MACSILCFSFSEKKRRRKKINFWLIQICLKFVVFLCWVERETRGEQVGGKNKCLQKQLAESVSYNRHSAFSICSDISRAKKHQHKIVGALYRSTNLGGRIRDLYLFKRAEIPLRTRNKSSPFPGAQTHLLSPWCLWHLSQPSSSGHLGARNVLFVPCFFIAQFSGISSVTWALNAFTVIAGLFPL